MNMRVGKLELRSCNVNLQPVEPHTTLEIVRWFNSPNERGEKGCVTVAYWVDEGGWLKLRTDEVFQSTVLRDDFWFLAETGQVYLDREESE